MNVRKTGKQNYKELTYYFMLKYSKISACCITDIKFIPLNLRILSQFILALWINTLHTHFDAVAPLEC